MVDFLKELEKQRTAAAVAAQPEPAALSTPAEPVEKVDLPIGQHTYEYLAGAAGCGKTWLAKKLVQQEKGVVLAATTGIASVNLGEGTTINALLKFFDTASLQENYITGRLKWTLAKLSRSGVKRILIDEVSMMDAQQLTILTRALEETALEASVLDAAMRDDDFDEPVSPIGVTLIGDFAQLSPVKAPYAFESPEWHRYAAHTTTLTKIMRQTDVGFITALRAARVGDFQTVVDFFGPTMQGQQDPDFAGTTIVATNDAVDRINMLRMDRLPGNYVGVPAELWGKPRGDWKLIPAVLQLKVGALVMVLANGYEDDDLSYSGKKLVYANGDLGEVVELIPFKGTQPLKFTVKVKLHRNGQVVKIDYVTRQNLIPLEPGRKKALTAEKHPERVNGKNEVIGEVTYMPLRVAYASTVHKCQGLTLDEVQINIKEPFFMAPHMLYVALSRARNTEGLRLVGTPEMLRSRCTVHPKIGAFL